VKSAYKFFFNHFLVATPHVRLGFFKESVIYLLEHNLQGALGLVVNVPSPFKVSDLSKLIKKNHVIDYQAINEFIYVGGPVFHENIFVLHEFNSSYVHTTSFGDIALTSSSYVLIDIFNGKNIGLHLIALGCAIWQADQLEQEIKNGLWFTYPADNKLLFQISFEQKRDLILKKLGANVSTFNFYVGHA